MTQHLPTALLALFTSLAAMLWFVLLHDIDPGLIDNGTCSGSLLLLCRLSVWLLATLTLPLAFWGARWTRRGAAVLPLGLLVCDRRVTRLDAARAAACGPAWPAASP